MFYQFSTVNNVIKVVVQITPAFGEQQVSALKTADGHMAMTSSLPGSHFSQQQIISEPPSKILPLIAGVWSARSSASLTTFVGHVCDSHEFIWDFQEPHASLEQYDVQ